MSNIKYPSVRSKCGPEIERALVDFFGMLKISQRFQCNTSCCYFSITTKLPLEVIGKLLRMALIGKFAAQLGGGDLKMSWVVEGGLDLVGLKVTMGEGGEVFV